MLLDANRVINEDVTVDDVTIAESTVAPPRNTHVNVFSVRPGFARLLDRAHHNYVYFLRNKNRLQKPLPMVCGMGHDEK